MSNHETLRAWVGAGGMGPLPPTIAEVAKVLGCSQSTARARLEALVESGMLLKVPGVARGYRLTDSGQQIAMSL